MTGELVQWPSHAVKYDQCPPGRICRFIDHLCKSGLFSFWSVLQACLWQALYILCHFILSSLAFLGTDTKGKRFLFRKPLMKYNPRDGGAWAGCVPESHREWDRLKWLNFSSSSSKLSIGISQFTVCFHGTLSGVCYWLLKLMVLIGPKRQESEEYMHTWAEIAQNLSSLCFFLACPLLPSRWHLGSHWKSNEGRHRVHRVVSRVGSWPHLEL